MNLQNRISDLDKTIKNIRTFSQPDIPGVYCEQYFKNIITNILKNEKNTFSFIFGDVNKLGELNNSFGFKFGDIALSNLLTLIKKNLPSNAYISRLGGDEFSFILPNTKKYECDEILDNLRQVISDNSSFVAGLSIEMASEDSTSGDLNTLHKLTDTQVSNNKHHRKNQKKDYSINPDDFIPLELPQYDISDSEKKSWIQLNNMINMTVCNFLQNIRPSQNLNFEQDQITDSSVFVADVLSDLLNESILQTNSTNSCEHNLIQKNIDPTIAKSIHNLVTNDNTNIEKIINSLSPNSINKLTNVLDSVLNDLVRDKSSDLLSKGYFRLYLAEKLSNSDEQYQAIYFSTTGIKLSNTAYGHLFTDKRLFKTTDLLINTFLEHSNFNNEPFNCTDSDTFFLSQGGGNFLVLVPQKEKLSIESVNSMLKTINDSHIFSDPSSSFLMSAAIDDCINKSDKATFISSVRNLKNKSNEKKVNLKKELFKDHDMKEAFRESLINCTQFYKENIPDSTDNIYKKSLFFNNNVSIIKLIINI